MIRKVQQYQSKPKKSLMLNSGQLQKKSHENQQLSYQTNKLLQYIELQLSDLQNTLHYIQKKHSLNQIKQSISHSYSIFSETEPIFRQLKISFIYDKIKKLVNCFSIIYLVLMDHIERPSKNQFQPNAPKKLQIDDLNTNKQNGLKIINSLINSSADIIETQSGIHLYNEQYNRYVESDRDRLKRKTKEQAKDDKVQKSQKDKFKQEVINQINSDAYGSPTPDELSLFFNLNNNRYGSQLQSQTFQDQLQEIACFFKESQHDALQFLNKSRDNFELFNFTDGMKDAITSYKSEKETQINGFVQKVKFLFQSMTKKAIQRQKMVQQKMAELKQLEERIKKPKSLQFQTQTIYNFDEQISRLKQKIQQITINYNTLKDFKSNSVQYDQKTLTLTQHKILVKDRQILILKNQIQDKTHFITFINQKISLGTDTKVLKRISNIYKNHAKKNNNNRLKSQLELLQKDTQAQNHLLKSKVSFNSKSESNSYQFSKGQILVDRQSFNQDQINQNYDHKNANQIQTIAKKKRKQGASIISTGEKRNSSFYSKDININVNLLESNNPQSRVNQSLSSKDLQLDEQDAAIQGSNETGRLKQKRKLISSQKNKIAEKINNHQKKSIYKVQESKKSVFPKNSTSSPQQQQVQLNKNQKLVTTNHSKTNISTKRNQSQNHNQNITQRQLSSKYNQRQIQEQAEQQEQDVFFQNQHNFNNQHDQQVRGLIKKNIKRQQRRSQNIKGYTSNPQRRPQKNKSHTIQNIKNQYQKCLKNKFQKCLKNQFQQCIKNQYEEQEQINDTHDNLQGVPTSNMTKRMSRTSNPNNMTKQRTKNSGTAYNNQKSQNVGQLQQLNDQQYNRQQDDQQSDLLQDQLQDQLQNQFQGQLQGQLQDQQLDYQSVNVSQRNRFQNLKDMEKDKMLSTYYTTLYKNQKTVSSRLVSKMFDIKIQGNLKKQFPEQLMNNKINIKSRPNPIQGPQQRKSTINKIIPAIQRQLLKKQTKLLDGKQSKRKDSHNISVENVNNQNQKSATQNLQKIKIQEPFQNRLNPYQSSTTLRSDSKKQINSQMSDEMYNNLKFSKKNSTFSNSDKQKIIKFSNSYFDRDPFTSIQDSPNNKVDQIFQKAAIKMAKNSKNIEQFKIKLKKAHISRCGQNCKHLQRYLKNFDKFRIDQRCPMKIHVQNVHDSIDKGQMYKKQKQNAVNFPTINNLSTNLSSSKGFSFANVPTILAKKL